MSLADGSLVESGLPRALAMSMLTSDDHPQQPSLAEPTLSLSNPRRPVRPAGPAAQRAPVWQRLLSEAIRDPVELCRVLDIELPQRAGAAADSFGMLAPRGFVDRMGRGDPEDPLLLQVLPVGNEVTPSLLPADAVGDLTAMRAPGLIHKYQGRALLTLSGQCAINCRYCFRRHFPYGSLPHGEAAWEPALQALNADSSIQEVILSGGDPLLVSDRRLKGLFDRLESIPHISTIRVHTRLPVVIPERVTETLCRTLDSSLTQVVVVTHINHANEIDETVVRAIDRLGAVCDFLLNQSVLLRRVNDSAETLEALSRKLLSVGVMPYYLHELDLVNGVQHFQTLPGTGVPLIASLRKVLPGYAVPRLVREEAGLPNKTVLA